MMMQPNSTTLLENRKRSSSESKGVSSEVIYNTIIETLRARGAGGSCLDFGAGQGALLELLDRTGWFSSLAGVDLMGGPPSLRQKVSWTTQDLNLPLDFAGNRFDTVISSEVIEHLENPRAVFREFYRVLKPGGILVISTPNQESIRSKISLLTKGHFDQFRDRDYPRHITALLHQDLARCACEAGFQGGSLGFTDSGLMPLPKLAVRWQAIAPRVFRGNHFSDNVIYSCIKK
jgi:2-polyprenyl-3-methyl-5-hydroxy-6-metoxy-1,4-benzoquinol methylase